MTDEVQNEFSDQQNIDEAPSLEFSEVPDNSNDMIASGPAGTAYDWSNAPDISKAPPRTMMNGMTITVKKADIILPPTNTPWDKTRDKSKDVKYCQFIVYYDYEGQQENYSGVRVFNRDGKYSHPTITKDGNNQASKLLVAYATYKKKDPNEVSLREFMGFMNSQPKAIITSTNVTNPETKAVVTKNMIESFVD